VLAVAAPLVAMVAWSRLLAPTAPRRLTGRVALAVELSIFAVATCALLASASVLVGVIYGSFTVGNSLLTRALDQYAPAECVPAAEPT
jgi:hypothetical protein